jgi:hypothetical protein
MTLAELGFQLWLGEGIPLGDNSLQPSFSYGGRMRLRPSPAVALEAGVASLPGGIDLGLDGLGFVGEPSEDVVLVLALGTGLRAAELPIPLVTAGFSLDLRLAGVLDLRTDLRLSWTWNDGVGVALGVGPQIHTPRRFDKDGDGISDRVDRCPTEPEDFDGFLDADGCPDPDNDNDAVSDTVDACPNIPEDRDGFLDDDGCPDPDNDGDGIMDARDACINEPEDFDGFRDLDGCPDPDNDEDGVPDTVDACPNVPEDRDGFEDEDGCPDPDNDGDGVGDLFDLAPNDPETINFFEDDDGVPDVIPPLLARSLGMQPRIRFEGSRLTEAGLARVELLAAALAAFPEVRVGIIVRDDDAERAGKRALNVASALVEMGVAADRIEPEGIGLVVPPGEPAVEGEPGVEVALIP